MSKPVKCPSCEVMNDKENTMKIGTRYYCIDCGKQKEKEIERNKDGWDVLFQYICKLYKIKKPNGMMFEQIKRFRSEPYEYTNTGMYLTLKYYYDVLGNNVLDDTGLGIIPYYYDKAKNHFIKKMNIEQYMEDFELKEETKIIAIKSPIEATKSSLIKQLSFNNIIREEEVDGQE